MQVHEDRLAAGGFAFSEGDARQAPLHVVVLPGLLAEAHPLGELALADDMVGGITCAGERSVVTHGLKGLIV